MVPALTSLKALNYTCVVLIYSVTSNSLGPWTIAQQALLSMEFSKQNTGVGCHFLLQGIFLTQGSNLGVLPCRQILYQLSYKGNPILKNCIYFWFPWGFLAVRHFLPWRPVGAAL